MLDQEKIFSVKELIEFINSLIRHRVIVQGEVGEKINRYPNYTIFSLLDKKKEGVLKCFAWQRNLDKSGCQLGPGQEVKIEGTCQVYPKRGDLTLQVEKVGLVGEGALRRAYEALKKRLGEDGFFALERKRKLPPFCRTIGLITSQYGRGALPDFIKHLGAFNFEIFFYDVRVEGLSAEEEIERAIDWFNQSAKKIDALILIRGGGSWESLQPFNSETVARSIFASRLPVVCGVGHESDETIADYVADVRASTPTDAARILSDPWRMAQSQMPVFEKSMTAAIKEKIVLAKQRTVFLEEQIEKAITGEIESKKESFLYLADAMNNSFREYFQNFYQTEALFLNNLYKIEGLIRQQKSDTLEYLEELHQNGFSWLEKIRQKLAREKEKIFLASPALKLRQGYSIVSDSSSGKVIKHVSQLKKGQRIETRFSDGRAGSQVEKVFKKQ